MVIQPESDLDVQSLVMDELEWSPDVDAAGIGVSVEDGTVTLSGEVDSVAERLAAKKAASRVRGVRTIVNDVTVHPKASSPATVNSMITLAGRPSRADTEERIRNALTRNALLDAKKIHVTVQGDRVVLTGTVSSWAERRQAGDTAWGSPHVRFVDNEILVRTV